MSHMNPVVHFEMPAGDRTRMAKFYSKAFGWKTIMLGADMMNYTLVHTTETGKNGMVKSKGAINGGFYPRKKGATDQHPSLVISIPNIKDAIKKVTKAGGKMEMEPMMIPGYGLYATFIDTEGNRVSMMQGMKKM